MTVAFGMQDAAKEEDIQAQERAFEILNIFLKDSQYTAGDELTIADFSIITSVCSMVVSITVLFKCMNVFYNLCKICA